MERPPGIYTVKLRRVDKRRSAWTRTAVVQDFDNNTDGWRRSERARTTRHARCPASVTAYRPASAFARRPYVWSLARWNESFEDESTKFFLRIAEYATGPEAKTNPTTARRIGLARDSSIPWSASDGASEEKPASTSAARPGSIRSRTNVPPFAPHFPLTWRIHVLTSVGRLEQGDIRREHDGPIDVADVRVNRGVQMVKLARREDVRRASFLVDPEHAGSPRWRGCCAAQDRE